jgi:hypothetical protein
MAEGVTDATVRVGRTPTPRRELPPLVGVAALLAPTGLFAWWALAEGAYFDGAFYPGAALLALLAAVLLWAAPWPASLRRSRPVAVTLAALVALAAWTALSAFWSPVPDVAIRDAQRVLAYALAFGCGLWACVLLGRLRELALASLAFAAGIAGVVTALRLLAADGPLGLLELDGTLEFPLGYRNATAAFFLLALWPALALATSPRTHRTLRAGAVGIAALCVAMGLLTQSRGAVLATACALVAFFALVPRRRAAAGWLVLAALAAAPVTFFASDLYRTVNDGLGPTAVRDAMRTAGAAALAAAAVGALLALAALRWAPAAPLEGEVPRWSGSRRLGAAAAVVAAAAVLLVAAVGSPASWIGERLDEFRAGGQPDLSAQSTRFSLSASSNRSDLWRVALDAARANPLRGDGAGGFEERYLRERRHVAQYAQDAHNVWLEPLAELGIPAVLLLGAAVVGAAWALARARPRGPATATLVAGAAGAGAYWLLHASLDWFWTYPGVTAPVFLIVGAAAAPSLVARTTKPGAGERRARLALGAACALFVVTLAPPYLADQYMRRALADPAANPERAYEDVKRAAELDPLSSEPELAEARIAQRLGDRQRALDAFRSVLRERPDEPVALYNLALLLASRDRGTALEMLDRLRLVDPLSPEVEAARARIRAGRPSSDRGQVRTGEDEPRTGARKHAGASGAAGNGAGRKSVPSDRKSQQRKSRRARRDAPRAEGGRARG